MLISHRTTNGCPIHKPTIQQNARDVMTKLRLARSPSPTAMPPGTPLPNGSLTPRGLAGPARSIPGPTINGVMHPQQARDLSRVNLQLARENGVTLNVRSSPGWSSREQKADAARKVDALNEAAKAGNLKVTKEKPARSPGTRGKFQREGGTVLKGRDLRPPPRSTTGWYAAV